MTLIYKQVQLTLIDHNLISIATLYSKDRSLWAIRAQIWLNRNSLLLGMQIEEKKTVLVICDKNRCISIASIGNPSSMNPKINYLSKIMYTIYLILAQDNILLVENQKSVKLDTCSAVNPLFQLSSYNPSPRSDLTLHLPIYLTINMTQIPNATLI